MSFSEIALIIVIALMLFGAKNVPEIARTLGKTIAQIKNTTNEIKSEIQKSSDFKEFAEIQTDIQKDLKLETNVEEITQQIDKIKEDIEDLNGHIKRQ